MTVSFSDLHTEAGVKALDVYLTGKVFIAGKEMSKDDVTVYAFVPKDLADKFPNVRRWYNTVASTLAARFPGAPVGVSIGGTASVAGISKDASAAEDDDLDLFGDETEEEQKAAAEREAAIKAKPKKKQSGKSSVVLDVKPWDDETDMKKLEEIVRSIEMPGLLWGASKLAAVGYGIKKLQIMMTIVDDLVSVDDLIEDYLTVEPANEYVQSCDIVVFNKI